MPATCQAWGSLGCSCASQRCFLAKWQQHGGALVSRKVGFELAGSEPAGLAPPAAAHMEGVMPSSPRSDTPDSNSLDSMTGSVSTTPHPLPSDLVAQQVLVAGVVVVDVGLFFRSLSPSVSSTIMRKFAGLPHVRKQAPNMSSSSGHDAACYQGISSPLNA